MQGSSDAGETDCGPWALAIRMVRNLRIPNEPGTYLGKLPTYIAN